MVKSTHMLGSWFLRVFPVSDVKAIQLSIYPSIHPSIPISPFIHPSFIHSSNHQAIHAFITHLSIHSSPIHPLSIHQFIYPSSIHPSFINHLFIYPFIPHLPIHPSSTHVCLATSHLPGLMLQMKFRTKHRSWGSNSQLSTVAILGVVPSQRTVLEI